jgi:hypothetical protein
MKKIIKNEPTWNWFFKLIEQNNPIDEPTEDESTRSVFILVGPPSVGKSTWIQNNIPDAYVINHDNIVQEVASQMGMTYDDMFMSPPPGSEIGEDHGKYGKVIASPEWMTWQDVVYDNILNAHGVINEKFSSLVSGASGYDGDIVVDMTNMNKATRSKMLSDLPTDAKKIAVDFKFHGIEPIIKKVAAKRAEMYKQQGKSKTIPDSAFERIFSSYEPPSQEEGFDEIISVDNTEALTRLVNENISVDDMLIECDIHKLF